MTGLSTPSSIFIELKPPPPLTNEKIGRKYGFLQRLRKEYQAKILSQVQYALPRTPYPRARIWYTRYSCKCPDYDGLVDSFKQIQDALVNVGLIAGDTMKHVGKPQYDWVQVFPGQSRVTIVVQPVVDDTVVL